MNRVEMQGLFWELVGFTSGYSRAPGGGSPAGPTLMVLIHESITEMVREGRPLRCRGYDELALSADVEQYALPTNLLDWSDIEEPITVGGHPVKQRLRGQVEMWRDNGCGPDDGCPMVWYEVGAATSGDNFGQRMIGFYPVPTSAMVAKLHFIRIPLKLDASGMLDSTEYPDLDPDFHQAPVYKTVWEWYQRRKEVTPKDISGYLNYYNSKLAGLKKASNERLRPLMQSRTPAPIFGQIECWDPVD